MLELKLHSSKVIYSALIRPLFSFAIQNRFVLGLAFEVPDLVTQILTVVRFSFVISLIIDFGRSLLACVLRRYLRVEGCDR